MNFKFAFLLEILFFILNQAYGKYPVILIPGDGGTQLEAKYVDTPPHYICGWENHWFLLWLNAYLMLPITVDCFVQTIKLDFDPKTNRSSVPQYCLTRTPKFGDPMALEYLSSIKLKSTSYFYYVINDLITKHGYIPNKDLRGVPYDFRYCPDNDFSTNLKNLIIDTYNQNNETPVIILGHSLGNLYTISLLNKLDDVFKKKYIKSFISTSGPYGGSVEAIRTVLSGNNEHVIFLKPIYLRPAQSSWPSTYYLMPNKLMGTGSKTIVSTKTNNYTVSTLNLLMRNSNIPNAEQLYKVSIAPNLPKPPNVSVYCVYTDNMDTAEYLDYRKEDFPDQQPEIVYGKGDGTVNLASLQVCDGWAKQQKQPVETHVIPGVSHLNIIRDERFVELVNKIVLKENAL